MLKRLELTNWQKHSHLILDFTNGVNVLCGETEAGKSCIRRAIEWLYFGESIDNLRKEGTKKTSVKATLDNDVVVERIKSASVNAYILKKPGEEKERFDAVGRNIPEEVQKALKVRTIKVDEEKIILNIAKQISLPFLMDKSGTFRMKLFNQLTGNDIIDKVFQSLNKDILHINKEEKIEKEHLEGNEKSLEELNKKRMETKKVCDSLSASYNELKKKLETYNKVSEYSQKLNSINKGLEETNSKLKDIKTVDENELLDLEVSIKRLEKLNELIYNIKRIKKDLIGVEEQLKKTIIPDIDIKELRKKIEKLTKLQKMITQLNDIAIADKKFTDNIGRIAKQIEEDNKRYKEILKEIKICPFFKKKCPLNKEIEV